MENVINYSTKYGLISLLKNEIYIGNSFNNGGYWDEDTLLKLKKYIDPSLNILEIGGHCGTSSIVYASLINKNLKLYVYEPQEEMYKLLVKNIYQNGLENKIIAKKQGVFCFAGSGKMNNKDMDGCGGDVLKRYNEEKHLPCNFGGICLGVNGETIDMITVDDMNLSKLGFIHCDAQGSENFIFSKSLKTINDNKPFIFYENNETHGKYLYENVCKSYPEYKSESKFDVKKYCIERLNYTCIERFNDSIDNLLIPPQKNFSKIIYITAKIINEKVLNVKNEWEKLNPEYKVELYNDEKCIEFLYKYYGEKHCDIFKFISDGPIKSDFFRICILYIFGGIYVDADIKPLIPLNNYIEDDLDFMTCISYNYNKNGSTSFCYNPQMIVAKKYSDILFRCICEYERLYDCKETQPYSYWSWSICTNLKKIDSFKLTANGDNIFMLENKKYKFIIEEILDKNTNNTYNFNNYAENAEFLIKNQNNLVIYCKYMDNIVLKNFDNK